MQLFVALSNIFYEYDRPQTKIVRLCNFR